MAFYRYAEENFTKIRQMGSRRDRGLEESKHTKNVYHISGDKDLMFPYNMIKNVTIVKGGTHIMIFNKAKQINTWLKEILEN